MHPMLSSVQVLARYILGNLWKRVRYLKKVRTEKVVVTVNYLNVN